MKLRSKTKVRAVALAAAASLGIMGAASAVTMVSYEYGSTYKVLKGTVPTYVHNDIAIKAMKVYDTDATHLTIVWYVTDLTSFDRYHDYYYALQTRGTNYALSTYIYRHANGSTTVGSTDASGISQNPGGTVSYNSTANTITWSGVSKAVVTRNGRATVPGGQSDWNAAGQPGNVYAYAYTGNFTGSIH